MSRGVEHGQVDVADGEHLPVGERRAGRVGLGLVPQHPVGGMEVCRCTGRGDDLGHRVDVVVVGVGAHDRDEPTATDAREDRRGVVGGVDDEHLAVVTEEPDVVVHLPRATVELEDTRGDEALDAHPAGGRRHRHPDIRRHDPSPMTTTERSTSPRRIFSNAASTSPIPILSVTNASRGKRPCR